MDMPALQWNVYHICFFCFFYLFIYFSFIYLFIYYFLVICCSQSLCRFQEKYQHFSRHGTIQESRGDGQDSETEEEPSSVWSRHISFLPPISDSSEAASCKVYTKLFCLIYNIIIGTDVDSNYRKTSC